MRGTLSDDSDKVSDATCDNFCPIEPLYHSTSKLWLNSTSPSDSISDTIRNDSCMNSDEDSAFELDNANDSVVEQTALDTTSSENTSKLNTSTLDEIYEEASLINPTPIRAHIFETYLDGYDKKLKDKVVRDVTSGVRLYSTLIDDGNHSTIYNHPSANENHSFVSDKLAQELAANRIAGPFKEKPTGLILSPIAAIPKKAPGAFRLIHDLSYPRNNSVNSCIPKQHSRVTYETLDDCVKIIAQIGEGCLVSKGDIRNAFRILPIDKHDYRLLGFHWGSGFWFDKSLAMGASSSCASFERLSCAVHWILQHKFGVEYLSHIIDDFVFMGPSDSSTCNRSLECFLALAKSIGLPLNEEKTVKPTTLVELHGIQVDTITMTLSLPPDKVDKGLDIVNTLISSNKAKIEQLQSAIGFLNFCCKIIPIGRPFLRRLIDLTMGDKPKWYQVRITRPIRQDLLVWKQFLEQHNGRAIITKSMWGVEEQLHVYTDSSKFAFAGVFGNEWFYGCFPENWLKTNIATKEFVPVYIALKV